MNNYLKQAFEDKSPWIQHHHIDKALNDEYWNVRWNVIQHPNATKEHIDKALNDEHSYVRRAAIQHPNATKEHIDKALNDEHSYVRDVAQRRLRDKDYKE